MTNKNTPKDGKGFRIVDPDCAEFANEGFLREEVGTQSIAQLTCVVTDGVRVSVPRVIANGGDSFGSQMLVNGVADNICGLVSQGMVDDVVANGVRDSVSQRMGVVNGVGVDGVRGNGVSEGMINGGSGLMANGVNESVPQGVVNGVGVNGVREGMINGARASAADVSATEIDKDHLLACFNRERITGLEALGNCEDAARTVRFWERMQLDDVEKGTRALLMMKETEAKIGEKARAIVEDERLAWDINGLCTGLDRIEERDGKMNKWLGQESLFLEILKSIVYGGLMEVIASLSIVASADASDAAT
nr:membrane protein of ER body-like protein [Tanacetum cinerariifolium]